MKTTTQVPEVTLTPTSQTNQHIFIVSIPERLRDKEL